MDFTTSVKTCLLEKYAQFEGRATRPEFWWFALFCLIVGVVADVVFRHWVVLLINLALLVPSLSVGARRLHDIGKTGWLQLLWLIPVIGWAILIYWLAQPGQPDANQHGVPPAPRALPDMAPGQQP